jgi:two-component system osmolarity sensor histidine kinase EnvZ
MSLKKILPKSLYGRFLLIIIASFAIVQLVSIYVFYYTHLDVISKHMARGIVEEMIFIKKSINKKGYEKLLTDLSQNTGLNFSFSEKKRLRRSNKIADSSMIPNVISEFFKPLTDPYNRFKLELEANHLIPYQIFSNPDNNNFITVQIQAYKGVLSFDVPIKRITSSTAYVFNFWMTATALIMAIIATIFFKNQVKSLRNLTIAAEKFGLGQEIANLHPSGAEEIRSLTKSFLKMQERINRQIAQRTETLSAVSHDLRTPLARMKLQISMLKKQDSQEIIDLNQDIEDMHQLINQYLDFSISDNQEKNSNISINILLKKIIENYHRIGLNISFESQIKDSKIITIKEIAFKRAIINIIDNAFNYGDKVIVNSSIINNELVIDIQDNGPGIAEKEIINVFKPFYRIDNSRNLDKKNIKVANSGSSGLGMSIALDSISLHRGNITLDRSKILGGLKVRITIPVNIQ